MGLCLAIAGSMAAARAQAADRTPSVKAPRGAHPPSGATLAPFAAHYMADWRGINVGTSDLELKPDTQPGDYVYTWTMTARGVFRLVYAKDVIQKSWFSVVDDHVRPAKYRAEDGTSTARIDFDWAAGRAQGESEKKPVDLPLLDGVQDIMSIQVEVMLDLRNGDLPGAFRIVDKNEIKEFIYAQEGHARIRTALGSLDTVIVSSRRTGGDRVLRMWFAPSLQFIPVLAERSRDGKTEFTMKIRTLKNADRSGGGRAAADGPGADPGEPGSGSADRPNDALDPGGGR